ncbi:VOC family protein [Gordonia alkaliphila]|uniref:VOC family protein n=1 Tax=Gordonia alkaliphila TaxID=1053547 RepID=A0ABP8Z934_9ACTN
MTNRTLRMAMITVDTTDALALSDWWRDAFDATVLQENEGFFVVLSLGEGMPLLAFQQVEDPDGVEGPLSAAPADRAKNRIHLDLVADDRSAAVARLLDAGATLIAEREMPGMSWVTLADPDGNQFCVAAAADH